jgi:iron complex outermembrane receptor protein
MKINKITKIINKALTVVPVLLCGGLLLEVQAAVTVEKVRAENQAPKAIADEVETIIVTGIRGSLYNASAIKRSSATVVDVITAEDLGQFSDDSIAETIQRIPGVQVERNSNGIEGDRVSIRGLGSNFVTTSINGRTPLSFGTEGKANFNQFNLNVLPTEIASEIIITKTPSAEMIESGIGGSLEVKTLNVFSIDFKGHANYTGVLNVEGDHTTLNGDTDLRTSGVFAFKNDDETFGAYASFFQTDSSLAVDEMIGSRFVRRDVNFDTTGDGLADTVEQDIYTQSNISGTAIRGEIERSALALGLQWQPLEQLSVKAEYLNSKFDSYSERDNFEVNFDYTGVFQADGTGPDGATISNGQVDSINGSRIVGGNGVSIASQQFLFDNLADQSNAGLNLVWTDERWSASVDFSASKMDFFQDIEFPIFRVGASAIDQSQFRFDAFGDVPRFNFGEEVQQPGASDYAGIFRRFFDTESEQQAIKADFEYYLNDSVTFKTGIRSTTMDLKFIERSGFWSRTDEELVAVNAAVLADGSVGEDVFPDETNGGFNNGLVSNFDVLRDIIPEALSDPLAINDSTLMVAEEDTLALYVQIDINGEIFGGLPYSSNVGLRWVETSTEISANAGVRVTDFKNDNILSSEFLPVTSSNTYSELLPSVNINLELKDDLQLRLGVSKALSRPELTQLAPRDTITFIDPNDPLYDTDVNPTANAGNADLKPFTAWQYDATLEYYYADNASVVVSAFYKDVSDFILTTSTFDTTLPGQGDQLFDVTQPVNVDNGQVTGMELAVNHAFETFEGFGVQAAYTFIDSNFDGDYQELEQGFPGSSKHSYNVMGYYEDDAFSFRLSYTWRDSYFLALGGGSDRALYPSSREAQQSLDASMSYTFNDHFSVRLSAANLTDEKLINYRETEGNFRDITTLPQRFTLGVTAKF